MADARFSRRTCWAICATRPGGTCSIRRATISEPRRCLKRERRPMPGSTTSCAWQTDGSPNRASIIRCFRSAEYLSRGLDGLEHDLRANAFRVCREGKRVPTFPDHALEPQDVGECQLAGVHVHAAEFGAAMQRRKHFSGVEQPLR